MDDVLLGVPRTATVSVGLMLALLKKHQTEEDFTEIKTAIVSIVMFEHLCFSKQYT
jgi:hypothetical protein